MHKAKLALSSGQSKKKACHDHHAISPKTKPWPSKYIEKLHLFFFPFCCPFPGARLVWNTTWGNPFPSNKPYGPNWAKSPSFVPHALSHGDFTPYAATRILKPTTSCKQEDSSRMCFYAYSLLQCYNNHGRPIKSIENGINNIHGLGEK